MKTVVIWKGKEYEVPSWAKWLAVDSDGDVWVYDQQPIAGCIWWWAVGRGLEQLTNEYDPEPKDFTKELYKLEVEK